MTAPADRAPVVRHGVVESTQTIAFDLAERGAADRTVVVADVQTVGRGRRGRVWHADSGTSLLMSILLRPRLAPSRLPALSFAAAIAVAGALSRLGDVAPRLKWPNDVLVRGRKIAGVLLESRLRGAEAVVVIGIGVNLAQRDFPASVGETATSVFLESGRLVDREAALTVLLEEFDGWRTCLEDEGFAPLRVRWLALSDTIGRAVKAEGVTGVAVDLAMDGALLVDDGRSVCRVVAGNVVPFSDDAGLARAVANPGVGAGGVAAGGSRDAAGR